MKISSLFLRGSVGLEAKMNDERMISQTPTCLADCSKYVCVCVCVRERESQWRKVSECGLSCWLVFPAARKRRERMCALSCWQGLSCPKGLRKRESERMLLCLFIVARGKWPGQNGMKYSHWSKIWVRDQNS